MSWRDGLMSEQQGASMIKSLCSFTRTIAASVVVGALGVLSELEKAVYAAAEGQIVGPVVVFYIDDRSPIGGPGSPAFPVIPVCPDRNCKDYGVHLLSPIWMETGGRILLSGTGV